MGVEQFVEPFKVGKQFAQLKVISGERRNKSEIRTMIQRLRRLRMRRRAQKMKEIDGGGHCRLVRKLRRKMRISPARKLRRKR